MPKKQPCGWEIPKDLNIKRNINRIKEIKEELKRIITE
jgi:hypothetical protein